MTMKRAITGFLSGIFLLCMVSQLQAIPVTANSLFDDGVTVTGAVEIDKAGLPYVTSWNLPASGGISGAPGFVRTGSGAAVVLPPESGAHLLLGSGLLGLGLWRYRKNLKS